MSTIPTSAEERRAAWEVEHLRKEMASTPIHRYERGLITLDDLLTLLHIVREETEPVSQPDPDPIDNEEFVMRIPDGASEALQAVIAARRETLTQTLDDEYGDGPIVGTGNAGEGCGA